MGMHSLVGRRFGRWIVLDCDKLGNTNVARWRVRCDCGNEKSVLQLSLFRGESTSCGCFQREQLSARQKKHGHRGNGNSACSREYRAWNHAKTRCFNPKYPASKHYLARGITMCARWKNSFAAFFEDMGTCPPGLTLDRIDNNGNYEPGNCRWATWSQQRRNQRMTTEIKQTTEQ